MFNTTVAWITLRATLSRRRALLFALPAVILILLTVALKASHPPMRLWPSHVLGTFGFSVLIPLTALIIGTSVLGAEIDDGSIVHLLARILIGGTLTGRSAVTAVELTRAGLQVRTSDYGAFCRDIAVLARDHGIRLREVLPADESLESVFAYLIDADGPRAR